MVSRAKLPQTQEGRASSLFCPKVPSDIDHVPISVLFGQAPPFAPILCDVSICAQHVQIADFCRLPLFWKALFDLLLPFYFPPQGFHDGL